MRTHARIPAVALGALAIMQLSAVAAAQGTTAPAFIENRGQWPAEVRYQYRQGPATAWVQDDGLTLALVRYGAPRPSAPDGLGLPAPGEPEAGVALRWTFEAATGAPRGEAPRVARHSFFVGNDPARWASSVPAFARVVQDGIYPGVDLVWQRRDGRLAYDLRVAPGAEASAVVVRVDGGDALRVAADGRLVVPTALGDVALTPPVSWEVTADGRRPVASRFARVGDRRYRIEVDRVDARLPLVVDPGLEWATFLGGAADDTPQAMRTDGADRIYVAGYVEKGAFPTTPGVLQPAPVGGSTDMIVACLDASASTLLWSTHVGGSDQDVAYDLYVPPGGDPVTVVGMASVGSTDFPLTPGAYQSVPGGSTDAVFLQLSTSGAALAYSSLLGSNGTDHLCAIESDGSGGFTIAGYTRSPGFPTTPGAFQTSFGGGIGEAFVAQFDPGLTGSAQLRFSTFLGGRFGEGVFGGTNPYDWDQLDVFVEPGGTVTVAGRTNSPDFPVTPGAFGPVHGGGADIFLSRLDPSLSTLVYSSYVGAMRAEAPFQVLVDMNGDVVLNGYTYSPTFPVTTGAYQTTYGGPGFNDGVLVKLRPAGQGSQDLLYSTYLGSTAHDPTTGLAVESSGIIVACGATGGGLQPTPGAWDTSFVGNSMGYVLRLDPAGNGAADMHYLSYLGAGGLQSPPSLWEWAQDLVQRQDGRVVVLAYTDNPAFTSLTTPGVYQPAYGGGAWDSFLAQLDLLPSNMTRFGASTGACLGDIDLQVNQMPAPGATSFQLICNDAPPAAPGVLLVGTQLATAIPVLNADVWVLPAVTLPLTAGSGTARTPIPLWSSLPTPLPAVAFQYLWLTTASCPGSGPLATSDALSF